MGLATLVAVTSAFGQPQQNQSEAQTPPLRTLREIVDDRATVYDFGNGTRLKQHGENYFLTSNSHFGRHDTYFTPTQTVARFTEETVFGEPSNTVVATGEAAQQNYDLMRSYVQKLDALQAEKGEMIRFRPRIYSIPTDSQSIRVYDTRTTPHMRTLIENIE